MARRFVLFDVLLLMTYVICSFPVFTGVAFHEFSGLTILILFALHVSRHVGRVLRVADQKPTRNQKRANAGQGVRLFFNVVLLVALMTCAVSGVLISGAFLPMLGLFSPSGYYFWHPVHAMSAKLLMTLILVHIVVNLKRAISILRLGK